MFNMPDFYKYVTECATRVPRWAINAAVEEYVRRKWDNREKTEECASLAKRIALNHEEGNKGAALAPTPTLVLDSDKLIQAVQPSIEQARRDIFGQSTPPFSSLEDAAKWIELSAEQQYKPSQRNRQRADRLTREITERCCQLRGLLGIEPSFSLNTPSLDYAKPGNQWVHRVPVVAHSPLAKLESVVSDLAKSTGFSRAAVTSLILVGLPPVLPLARICFHNQYPGRQSPLDIRRHWVTMELYARDITYKQFRRIYREVGQPLKVTRTKPITTDHLELLRFVDSMGGEPSNRGGKRAFWERVQKAWNRKSRKKMYKTWRGLEMRYRRLQRKRSLS